MPVSSGPARRDALFRSIRNNALAIRVCVEQIDDRVVRAKMLRAVDQINETIRDAEREERRRARNP